MRRAAFDSTSLLGQPWRDSLCHARHSCTIRSLTHFCASELGNDKQKYKGVCRCGQAFWCSSMMQIGSCMAPRAQSLRRATMLCSSAHCTAADEARAQRRARSLMQPCTTRGRSGAHRSTLVLLCASIYKLSDAIPQGRLCGSPLQLGTLVADEFTAHKLCWLAGVPLAWICTQLDALHSIAHSASSHRPAAAASLSRLQE